MTIKELHESRLVVNEIFGPTLQGEGPSSGRRCAFLRLGGCNLTCTWCDTPYTWDWKGVSRTGVSFDSKRELHAMNAADVFGQLKLIADTLVVISGGEPLQQQEALVPLIESLTFIGLKVEVETNGTIIPRREFFVPNVQLNVSPKLAHSGVRAERAVRPDALGRLAESRGVVFKFVCRSVSDLAAVKNIVERFGISADAVWIMPEGSDVDTLLARLPDLADGAVAHGWNFSSRLQVLAWGDRRGV